MTSNLVQLEQAIRYLSFEEKLWLMEQIVHQLQDRSAVDTSPLNDQYIQEQIKAMANDPAIRAELDAVNEEFAIAETDGLQNV